MNIGTRRPPPRKIIMNVSVNDDVQLKKSENAWKPGMKRESLVDNPETQKTQVEQNIHKRVRRYYINTLATCTKLKSTWLKIYLTGI